jgi:hypothetical protein
MTTKHTTNMGADQGIFGGMRLSGKPIMGIRKDPVLIQNWQFIQTWEVDRM